MVPFKRKRDEVEDSDDEEPSFGRQILPVADLPEDFNDEPSDGMQYLFTVRRDARYLPQVTRVANPFEKEEPDTVQRDNRVIPTFITLPSEEWRVLLVTRFRNFRKNVNQPTIHVQLTAEKKLGRLMPEKKERDLWWAYIAGKPESDWNPPKKPKQSPKSSKRQRGMRGFADDPGSHHHPQGEPLQNDEGEVEKVLRGDSVESLPSPIYFAPSSETSIPREDQVVNSSLMGLEDVLPKRTTILKPREPIPSLLKQIDQKMALHLLMYFVHWFNLYLQQPDPATRPLETHARWIFALLSKVEDDISADDMSLLRNLARGCLGLLKKSIQTRTLPVVDSTKMKEDEPEMMSERACWIVVCTIVGVWAQRDLWMDAEDMVNAIDSEMMARD